MGQVDDQQLPGQEQMPFAKLGRSEARTRIQTYLNNKRSGLWGRAFDLRQAHSREEAEGFLLALLDDMDLVQKNYYN